MSSSSSSSSLADRLAHTPYPPGPLSWPAPLDRIVSQRVYEWTLQAWVPVAFSIIYYIVAHGANKFTGAKRGVSSGTDLTKGDGLLAKALRILVISHNAFLAVYSGWTFINMLPVVGNFLYVGARSAGFEGLKLALCSIPTNTVTLAPYAWLFYISKYYEVVDSMILVIKGKPVSNLQSYHHAGALLAMWIAYRYQSQAVWVFVTFNSGVHTAMYSYYFSSAMKLPFPSTLKRNLTTLQIAQITSGVILTNLYWITKLNPTLVATRLASVGFNQVLERPSVVSNLILSSSSSSKQSYTTAAGLELWQIATERAVLAPTASGSLSQQRCLESSGSSLALHLNTLYLVPLVVLFARFFIRSYVGSAQSKRTGAQRAKKAQGQAEQAIKDVDVGNGGEKRANGHHHQYTNGKASAVANGSGNGAAAAATKRR